NRIRQEQVESFGRLMAGFSHEMKNHLGIIRESNGLMGDLVAMGKLGDDDVLVQRFDKAIAAIEKRIGVAAEMLHHLSSFAHRSDTPYSSFQINSLLVEECIFLKRFSRLRQIDFSLQLDENLAAIYNDPSLLHHVLYRLHAFCLEQLSAGGSLAILTRQHGGCSEIIFRFRPAKGEEQNFDETLQKAVKKLHGTLKKTGKQENHNDIVLAIPSLVETL
ncbi:MAG: hypothetical protein ACWGOX_15690, partial [Desulforhopalus sp.]